MKNISSSRQFLVLLYKGYLLRKRHYIFTFFEIVIPVILASTFPIIESEQRNEHPEYYEFFSRKPEFRNATIFPPFSPYSKSDNGKFLFAYTPFNDVTKNFMDDAIQRFRENNEAKWEDPFDANIHSLNSEKELEDYCINEMTRNDKINIIGTIFSNFLPEEQELPESLEYKIRYGGPKSYNFETKKKYRMTGPNSDNDYKRSYFLGWQTAVEETFIQRKMEKSGKFLDYQVMMQRFPFPEYYQILDKSQIIEMTPMIIGYGFFVFMLNLIRRVIEEKSNGSKELMKMMGMTDAVYWSSTFVNYFIVCIPSVLAITIIFKAPLKNSYVFLQHIDPVLLFLILLLYVVSLILFCMAFTIFFRKAVFAIIAFITVWNIAFNLLLQNYFLVNFDKGFSTLPEIIKIGVSLIPAGSILPIFKYISHYEKSREGVQWYNLSEFAVNADFNMLSLLLTIASSCGVFILIIWYFDKVWPWQSGVPQPFYFCFTKSYWCGSPPKRISTTEFVELNNFDYFEPEPRNIVAGVVINNLFKIFKMGTQEKIAVNNLRLNMYKGQITALLGHNGAGKTTTINMLTGLYTPSSGNASINGKDITTDTTCARRGLGVCPQHNVLFDTLTVDEHLKIFAGLKGVKWKNVEKEAIEVMEILKLTNKRYELVENLSGGMKRKLSLGNAIIGGSEVLFLDEPTSGMDIEARRNVWDALLSIRRDRTIVLTTHYMEEADILGDRIAIMAEGEIQCCGSPMFLKRKFGTGYHLHLVKSPTFDVDETNLLLEKHIPDISVRKELQNEITYRLSTDCGSVIGNMFEELEESKQKLGINSCGITITTMEDVFIKVSNLSDVKYMKKGERQLRNGVSQEYDDVYGDTKSLKKQFLCYQLFAFLAKRFHYTKRHWIILITQFALPVLLVCVCFILIKNSQNQFRQNYEPLTLDIRSVYGNSEGIIHSTSTKNLSSQLEYFFKENKIKAIEVVDNPISYVLDYGKKSLSRYLTMLMVGASVRNYTDGKVKLTAWYNNEPYHALPMSLLLAHTAILRHVSSSQATISLTNSPLPKFEVAERYHGPGRVEGIFASVFIPLALGFMSATAVLIPIHERTSKAKLLQLMTGAPHVLYWTSMLLWDFALYLIVSVTLIIPFAAFYEYIFFSVNSNAIGTVLLVLALYGFSSIPLSYLLSFMIQKGNTGFAVVIALTCVMGIAVSTTLINIYGFLFGRTKDVINTLVWIFRIFPYYSVASGFNNLFRIAFQNAYCEGISAENLEYNCKPDMAKNNTLYKCCTDYCGENECLKKLSFVTWDRLACGRDVMFLFLDGIIYFTILIMIETSFFQAVYRKLKQNFKNFTQNNRIFGEIIQSSVIEDSEVIAEELRIRHLEDSNSGVGREALVITELSKIFKNFFAVDHLSLGIHKEECFGLLGVNGAGKTTTFRMLTGDCHPTDGNAFTAHHSLIQNTKKFRSYLGYCPQFDALIDRLTGRETLTLFARLRGLYGSELNDRVEMLIKMTDLSAHADKQTQFYSGGNKRKLSVGIALIGSPPIILLDEPTAGVDPVSRRKIWNILAQARYFTKAAIILTTHSMEECEALCSRLAIMVNGRFRCLGSIQQLKSKYGQGYTLVIKIAKETVEDQQSIFDIKTFIENKLPSADLKDDHQGMLQYHVTDPSVRLSQLFKLMEEMKRQFKLEDYLVSDTSLEQIFLTFARSQRAAE